MWLKKEIKENKILVFIRPDFFDFSNTNYPQGIPVFFKVFEKNEIEEVEKLIQWAEDIFTAGFEGLKESAEDEEKSEKEILGNWVKENPYTAIVRYYSAPNAEMTKMIYFLKLLHPFADLSGENERFGFGISISGVISEKREDDEIKEKSKELNEILLSLFNSYLDKKENGEI